MELLHWFKRNYQDLVQDMKNTNHDISPEIQSIFHAEGDVYTHTLMVYGLTQQYKDIELSLAALLHDIGKTRTQVDKGRNNQYSFTYHENVSVFMAIDILNRFEKDFEIEVDKEKILFTIGHHQVLHKIGHFEGTDYIFTDEDKIKANKMFGQRVDYFKFLVQLGKCDTLGRIAEDLDKAVKRYTFLETFEPYCYFKEETFDQRPKAIMLCGLPTSGKSSLAEKLMKEEDFVYLSSDAIMEELFSRGKQNYDMYYSKKNVMKAHQELHNRLEIAIKDRKNIIIDNTNLDPLIRNKKADIIPDKYYQKRAISVLIGEAELAERNMKRKKEGKYIEEDRIQYMSKEFELPTEEDFHDVEIIV